MEVTVQIQNCALGLSSLSPPPRRARVLALSLAPAGKTRTPSPKK